MPITETVDITGRWNPEEAKKYVLLALKNADWKRPKGFCSNSEKRLDSCMPDHSLLGEYDLQYKERMVKIVVTTTIEKFPIGTKGVFMAADGTIACHACAPYLSFF